MFSWKSNAQKQLELLSAIVEKQESFERRVKAVELDWENMYDKFRSILQRITKRAQDAEKAKEEAPEPPAVPLDSHGGRLTPHQRMVQQQVLRRRAGLSVNGEE
jgi:hypothetical protein